MERSESINELAAALAHAQAEMKAAEMNATNPFLKNRYADLGSIIEAIRPAIAKHGLAFAQLPTFDNQTVTVKTIIMHASGQWLASEISLSIEGEKGLSLAQVMGKAITYLRRYGLSAMFGVYADKDEDGNDTGAPSTTHAPVQQSAGPAPKCPKCGGAMWDNRQGKTNPKAPDFKCKDKACDGALWPPKDVPQEPPANGNHDAELDAIPGAAATTLCTDSQRKAMFALWSKLYGKDSVPQFRTWLKENYHTEHTSELTIAQASAVIDALKAEEQMANVA
jgi:hypothetical protein